MNNESMAISRLRSGDAIEFSLRYIPIIITSNNLVLTSKITHNTHKHGVASKNLGQDRPPRENGKAVSRK